MKQQSAFRARVAADPCQPVAEQPSKGSGVQLVRLSRQMLASAMVLIGSLVFGLMGYAVAWACAPLRLEAAAVGVLAVEPAALRYTEQPARRGAWPRIRPLRSSVKSWTSLQVLSCNGSREKLPPKLPLSCYWAADSTSRGNARSCCGDGDNVSE